MALDAELAAEHQIWAVVDLIQEGMRQHERISLIFSYSMASNAPDLGSGGPKRTVIANISSAIDGDENTLSTTISASSVASLFVGFEF
ncbi:unnamed protein product [Linum trigynum]|uniref:Uncharacterized protein n=1 Tax=Linum trigynum TaxID=586398 RepID=A0AAV2ERM4_9ROSI